MPPAPCKRKNLCFDCDDEKCYNRGQAMADCVQRDCVHTPRFDCENCDYIKNYRKEMREYYKNLPVYDMVLIEKEGIAGLTTTDIVKLQDLIDIENLPHGVFPIELEAHEHESSAMGFITPSAAETLCYDYETSGLHDFIANILDGMNLENENHIYKFKNLTIYLNCE